MLCGTSYHSMDNKNRIIIPQQFRQEMGDTLYVTVGYDRNLFLISKENFEHLAEKVMSVPETSFESREFRRTFFGNATACELDKMGRIVLPQYLISFANIQKDVAVIGVSDKLELWGMEEYNNYISGRTEERKSNMLTAMAGYGV